MLPVARAAAPLRLVTPEGEPVWPVRSDEELGDLRELAAVFGTGIQTVPPCPAPVRQGEQDEVVWGLGKQAFQAAELYAHLTGRSLHLVEGGAESTAGLGFASVVVTTAEMLTYELLERLSARPPGHPVAGIVVAASEEALHRQVLLRSATSVLCGPVREMRIDIAPTLKLPQKRGRVARVLSESASACEIREAMRTGAGLLNLLTHSDGVDACLGSSTTLCPIESIPHAGGGAAPTCVVRGICHRHSMSLEDATRGSFLTRPRDVAARLLVFHTCKGALAADSVVDGRWGLLPKLLDQPRIGAVATTWDMTLMVKEDLDRMAAPFQKGLPAGEALAHFLNMRPVRQRRLRLCLFGDPRLRLSASIRKLHKSDARLPSAGDIAFLEAYLHFQGTSKRPAAAGPIGEAKRALARYLSRAGHEGRTKSAMDTAGRLAREAILNVFCRFGSTPASDWNQFARIVRSVPSHSRCPQCGTPTQTWIMRIVRSEGSRRRMISCPRCGFVDDSPANYPHLQLRLHGSILRVAGPLPRDAWSARVMIDPNLPTGESPRRRWVNWPAAADGAPARHHYIGDSLEPWPMNLTLFLVDGLSVVALTCRVRA